MSGHSFLIEVGADTVAARAGNPHRGQRFPTAIEEDKDTKQVSYDYCFMQRSTRNGVSKDFSFEGSCHPHGVCSHGATERNSS